MQRKESREYVFLFGKTTRARRCLFVEAISPILQTQSTPYSERSINSEMYRKLNELCIGTGERIVPSRMVFVKLVRVVDDGFDKV